MQYSSLAVRISVVAQMLGCSDSTVRRALKFDQKFPRPFRLTPRGDLLWSVTELEAYIAAKSAQAQAA